MRLARVLTLLLVLVLPSALFMGVVRIYGARPGSNDTQEQADTVRTILQGLQYRESQPSRLLGEAVLDTYYGGAHWPSLERISDAVRETPQGARPDRDRVAVRFDLSRSHYRLEAQSVYWGGANPFFPADPREDPWNVGQMHHIRGVTEGGLGYQVSWSRGYPMVWYHPVDSTEVGFSGKWPAIWLGLIKRGAEPLSASVRERIDKAVSYSCVKDERAGLPCLRLTIYTHLTDSDDVSRARYWFAPEYDCALVRKESIHYSVDPAHADHRQVTEWRDFQQVPGLPSLFPRRWTYWSFVYSSTEYENPLNTVRDVHINSLNIEPPPEDDLLRTLMPPGALLRPPLAPSSRMGPDYEGRVMETARIRSEAYLWAKKPWEEVVPVFPEEWSEGLSQETIADLLAGAGVQ